MEEKPAGRPYVWSFVQQTGEQLVSFGVSVCLARLLLPKDFGLVAMVSVMSGFAGILLDLGFGNAIIHKDGVTPTDLATAFWTNLGIGMGLSAALYAGATYFADFYGEPRLVPIARTLSASFTLAGFVMVDSALLRKRLDFRAAARASVAASVISGGVGIALAASGAGAMALAAQTVARAFLTAVILRVLSGFSPTWSFRWSSLRAMLAYSWGIAGANVLNYWTRNTDNLLVGKWLGSAELGVYNRAYSLMMLPMNAVSRVVTSVLFPILAQKKNSPSEFREEFLRVASRVGFGTFPVMVGIGCSAEPLVRTLFGEQWGGSVWILQALAPLGLYQTIVALYGPIYLALGRTSLDFKWSLFVESVIILGIVGGLVWGNGISGLIVGLYSAVLVNSVPTNLVPLGLIKLPLLRFVRNLLPSFLAAMLMGGAVLGLGRVLSHVSAPGLLAVEVVAGVAVYASACWLLRVPAMLQLVQSLQRRRLSTAA